MFSLFSLQLLALALPTFAFQLHHRILHPTSQHSPFLHRASVLPDAAGNPRIESVPTLQSDFEAFAGFETPRATDALYQLALDPQGDSPWLISSVKAVRLVPTLRCTPLLIFLTSVPSRRYRQ